MGDGQGMIKRIAIGVGLGSGLLVVVWAVLPRQFVPLEYHGDAEDVIELVQSINGLVEAVNAGEGVTLTELCVADYHVADTLWVSLPTGDDEALEDVIAVREPARRLVASLARSLDLEWPDQRTETCGPRPVTYHGGNHDVSALVRGANALLRIRRLGGSVTLGEMCGVFPHYFNAQFATPGAGDGMALETNITMVRSMAEGILDWIAEQEQFGDWKGQLFMGCQNL